MPRRGTSLRGSLWIFVLGCIIGAALAFIMHHVEEKLAAITTMPIPRKKYSNVGHRRCFPKDLFDYEDLLYDSPNLNKTEAFILSQSVHVICVVFIRDESKALAARNTWGSRCNKLLFFGPRKSINIPIIEIKAKSSWHFLCETIQIVWKSHGSSLNWVLFLPESQFAIPENLRFYVEKLNYEKSYYMGHAVKFWGVDYNLAQAGYVLSKGAIRAVVKKFSSPGSCISGGKFWKNEDYYLGKHLKEMGIYPEDTRDSFGRGRFHGYNFNQLLFPGKISSLASYWTRSIHPVKEGRNCCSDYSITFHGTEPDKVYQHNYLIYQLKVFVHGGHIGNRPAPTPFPEDFVWKKFLLEEGIKGKNVDKVSSEEFFNIWKEKISVPTHFSRKLIGSGRRQAVHSDKVLANILSWSAVASNTSSTHNAH
ncbi:C1GALT1-specific chaperone 1-like [Ischnura elegans]|uniref:C1GALT1-specific chaperone 1-like n=1 Tax=Ischnura elegans TaxID=197161 RepID=UPI001ED88B4D|nr:C1GALT1-specific chaperone 1-like [Ischnura elegans]